MPGQVERNNVNYINYVRQQSELIRELIPEATTSNLGEIFKTLFSGYCPGKNEFLPTLCNRIGMTYYSNRAYKNTLPFERGALEWGNTAQEVYTNYLKARPYNPWNEDRELWKRAIPDVSSCYHKIDSRLVWDVTRNRNELQMAFISEYGLDQMLGSIMTSLQSSKEYAAMNQTKTLLNEAAANGWMYPVQIPAIASDTVEEVAVSLRTASNWLLNPSTLFNPMGVWGYTPREDQILIVTPATEAYFRTMILPYAFNEQYVSYLQDNMVMIDSFADENIQFMLVDRLWFAIFNYLEQMEDIYNPDTMDWKIILHVWKVYSASPFVSALAFTTEASTVTNITIDNQGDQLEVTKGQSLKILDTVTGTGLKPKTRNLEVTGGTQSYISQDGTLLVGQYETAATLTVTATSNFDPTKTVQAQITVNNP